MLSVAYPAAGRPETGRPRGGRAAGAHAASRPPGPAGTLLRPVTDVPETDGGTPGRRTGETESQRHTRQISELLQETRVAAVGIQVIVGFLLAVPFNATLAGLQRDAYLVALMSGMVAIGALIAPSVLHRALLHEGQSAWLVAVGTRLVLLGAVAITVSLTASALLVGDRVLDGWVRFLPAAWTLAWLAALWALLPAARDRRIRRGRPEAPTGPPG